MINSYLYAFNTQVADEVKDFGGAKNGNRLQVGIRPVSRAMRPIIVKTLSALFIASMEMYLVSIIWPHVMAQWRSLRYGEYRSPRDGIYKSNGAK